MPRSLDTNMEAALQLGLICPAILAVLTFRSSTQYVWSGVGPLTWNAMTFLGVGSLGKLGAISEGIEIKADGTSVTLSGIDPTLYGESMDDIQLGASATLYLALLEPTTGAIIGTPYTLYEGTVDKPTSTAGVGTIAITLALESRMTNLQRGTGRRYTSADQNIAYPSDSGFDWVEQLNDTALRWGI
jgi:hypothetical protein